MSEINPCMTCGACCAYFRVSFYWAEADDAGGLVPSALTEPLTPFLRCMSGTNQRQSAARPCLAISATPFTALFMKTGLRRVANSPCPGKIARKTMPATGRGRATACHHCGLFTKIYLP